MTPIQEAVGEVFFGLMETSLGQHRSFWSACEVDPLEDSRKIRLTCVSQSQNLSVSIVVKHNGDVTSIQIRPSHSFKIQFLAKSIQLALEVLRHAK